MGILRPGGSSLNNFPIDGDSCVRTDHSADCAAGAAILVNMGRMKPFGRQPRHVQAEHFLGTDTQT